MKASGFEVASSEYIHRQTVNKKEGLEVPRIFVQGKFVKPIKNNIAVTESGLMIEACENCGKPGVNEVALSNCTPVQEDKTWENCDRLRSELVKLDLDVDGIVESDCHDVSDQGDETWKNCDQLRSKFVKQDVDGIVESDCHDVSDQGDKTWKNCDQLRSKFVKQDVDGIVESDCHDVS